MFLEVIDRPEREVSLHFLTDIFQMWVELVIVSIYEGSGRSAKQQQPIHLPVSLPNNIIQPDPGTATPLPRTKPRPYHLRNLEKSYNVSISIR